MFGVVVAAGKLPWFVARSSGLVAWAVMTASVCLGLATAARLIRRKGAPAWMLELHKFFGLLTVVFTVVHLLGLVADTYTKFGFGEILVPLASKWRPWAVAGGVVAIYLLIAVEISSWLMKRLPRRVWHAIHLLSLPMFVLTTVHGLMSGADRGSLIVQWLCLTGLVLAVFTTVFRALSPRKARRTAAAVRPTSMLPPPNVEQLLVR